MSIIFDLDALRTMVVGVELDSFSRAASQLAKSQSAVSMQLRKLEHQAGKRLFKRSGRGLVLTVAGEALLAYARRLVALNDAAAAALGAAVVPPVVRMGLPQDYFACILPDIMDRFAVYRPDVHLEVRAGRNYLLNDEVRAGRLDAALAFHKAGSKTEGDLITTLPLHWLAADGFTLPADGRLPLVLFDHPCLFRQSALNALETAECPRRLSLTTPSLLGVWAATLAGHGVTVRTMYQVPTGIVDVGAKLGLPKLPSIELRVLAASDPSEPAKALSGIMIDVARKRAVLSPTQNGS